MQDIANANETKQTADDGDVYILIEEGRETFDIFDYSKEQLLAAGVPSSMIDKCLYDKHNIPEAYRPTLCNMGKNAFLARFEEKNNYYRMITGLPDYGDYGIPIKNYEYLIPTGETWSGSYVHELGYQGCRMLEKYGILDIIKQDYPDAKYLEYVTNTPVTQPSLNGAVPVIPGAAIPAPVIPGAPTGAPVIPTIPNAPTGGDANNSTGVFGNNGGITI